MTTMPKKLKIVDIAGNEIVEPVEPVEPVKNKVGRPKKNPNQTRKEYMREYMKNYVRENKADNLLYHNSRYYLANTEMTQEYMDKYGRYACLMYKAEQDLKDLKEKCPQFLEELLADIKND